MAEPVVIAMGGNSLLDPALPPTVPNQFAVTARAVVPIAELIGRGVHVVLTHGNGPQVGFMQLRSELAKGFIHEVPLDSLDADTQGAIGYMIQRALREELERRRLNDEVASLVTEIMVDPEDPGFQNPTKPIGKFYTADEAQKLTAERGWAMVDDAKRGWRRVVPSPHPKSIVQLKTIQRLVDAGVTVICVGGGGIPVMWGKDGHVHGLDAVIDKDRASALLASNIGAKQLIITTGVDAIYVNYKSPDSRALRETTPEELAKLAALGQFPPGSMGPKVEAAIDFLARGGEEVLICHPDALVEAYEGRAGTRIRRSPATGRSS